MNYQEAWSFLNDLQFFKIKLGLESMAAFLESLGNPQTGLKFVHVAGTNGKGSVCANLLALLGRGGYRVGLYTSPHLSSVRERFRINNDYIPENDFARHATAIRNILDGRQITYFEFTTALALLWFAEQQVDLVLLEVGLGGRLDATNVITPEVCVITNVAMDHEAYLGNTLSEIAAEKAGIVKPGVPVVSAVADDISREVVSRVCLEKKAPLYLLGRDFEVQCKNDGSWSYRGISADYVLNDLRGNLAGTYQLDNSAVGLAALELLAHRGFPVDRNRIAPAMAGVVWPGRLERFALTEPDLGKISGADVKAGLAPSGYRRYLLDGAHNPAGIESLIQYLADGADYQDLVMIWASMSDKDYSPSLARIVPLCRKIIFTRPEAERSATPEQLAACLPGEYRSRASAAVNIDEALKQARAATDGRDLIAVAGSLYLVGAARRILLGEIV